MTHTRNIFIGVAMAGLGMAMAACGGSDPDKKRMNVELRTEGTALQAKLGSPGDSDGAAGPGSQAGITLINMALRPDPAKPSQRRVMGAIKNNKTTDLKNVILEFDLKDKRRVRVGSVTATIDVIKAGQGHTFMSAPVTNKNVILATLVKIK